jgi:hypothetical protein
MSPPTVTVRCPSCGNGLRAVLAPAPPTQWFPCPSCHVPVPVVVPRDLPPLYSWEVLPGLYPQLSIPRRPRWRTSRVGSVALAVAAALAAVSAGVLGYEGFVAAEPSEYAVSGIVYEDNGGPAPVPVVGAKVALFVNGAAYATNFTGPGGRFDFPSVPSGGFELNVTAPGPGYGPTVVYTFASKAYSTQTRGLGITLEPGASDNVTVNDLTPFGDLETFLAYVGGAAVLLGGAAGVAAVAALAVRRAGGGVSGVIGAGAAVAVPAVLLVLSLGGTFPLVAVIAGAVGGAGGFALVVATAAVESRDAGADPA